MSGAEDALGTVFESVLSEGGDAASSVGDAITEGLKSVGDSFESLLGPDGGSGALDAAEGGSDAAAVPPSTGAPSEGFVDPTSANATAPGAAAADPTLTTGPGNVGSGGGGIPGGAGPEAGGTTAAVPKNGLLADALGNRGFVERNGNLIGGVVGGLGGGLSAMAKGQQEINLAKARQGIYNQNYGGGGGSGPGAVPPRIAGKNGLLFNPAGQATAPAGTAVSAGPGLPPTSVVQGPGRIQRFDTNFNGEWQVDPGTGRTVWVSHDSTGAAA